MSQTRRVEVRNLILQERISAIIRTRDQQLAHSAMLAAVEGGFRMIEFTLTTPGALELVAEFSARPGLLVGAGTVLTTAAARDAVEAGARFLVSPIVDARIIEEAAKLNVVSVPGAYTPTEMETAHRAGADFVKIFPAPAGGVGYIEAVLGPLPHLRLFPTNGVTADNVLDYLNAGCAGAGFVKTLFDPADMEERRFNAIRERAARIVARVSKWRHEHPVAAQPGRAVCR